MEEIQSNKDSYQFKKEKKLEKQQISSRRWMIKRTLKIAVSLIVIAGGVGALVWYSATRPTTPEDEILSRRGIHWHPELFIFTKGQKQEIPANLGIGIRHESIHTHDSSGVLHLEVQGLVRKKDTQLRRFFEIWGEQFNQNCILEFCNGSNGTVKMFVNGNPNTEFENYQMQNNDKIEIRYE
ncbi:MAG: hypothetical protein AAB584_02005 [Patescibacteria group bacterium]